MSASRHRRWGIARPRACVVATVIGLIALLAPGPALGGSPAAALGRCSPTHGTIVAVDFAHWGGPIVRGCGVGQPSGYALLHAAGFTTAGDEHDGPAVVCRIGASAFHHGAQYPTPAEESCIQTPPTTGYWGYWIALRGTNHWTYSPLGAMGDVPRPGEVDLWIFGATNVAGTRGTGVPTFSPAALRARAALRTRTSTTPTPRTSTSAARTRTTTTASTTHTTTTATTTHTTITTATHTTTTPPTTLTGAAKHRRASIAATHSAFHQGRRHPRRARHHAPRRPAEPTRRARRHRALRHAMSTTLSTSPTRAGGAKVVSARPTSRRSSAGSPTPLIIAVSLALLLCAGAGRAIWLRRREP